MKNKNRLYSLIFPIWLALLMPKLWLAILPADFLIDSIVLLVLYKLMKFDDIKARYLKTIFSAWGIGILSSLVGFGFMSLAFAVRSVAPSAETESVCESIMLNPFGNAVGFLWVLGAIIVSAAVGFFMNYKLTFNKRSFTKRQSIKCALVTAIATAPYTFLIPTAWFNV